MTGAPTGRVESILIQPRLFGRQCEMPMKKPGNGSGLISLRTPGVGLL